jgi:hypothetical protein
VEEIKTVRVWETADGYWRVALRMVGQRAFFSIYHGYSLVTSTPDMAGMEKILGDQVQQLREIKPGEAA